VSTQPVSVPFEEESEEEESLYIVKKVLAYSYRSDGQREYLLPWKRYSNYNDSWEPYGNLNQDLQIFVDNNNITIDVWQRQAPRPRRS
jgi:hypothetical protein